jgi:hypothetical protein
MLDAWTLPLNVSALELPVGLLATTMHPVIVQVPLKPTLLGASIYRTP